MTVHEPDEDRADGSPDGELDELAGGTVLAERYHVIGRVGAGGMGSVYEVIDEHLEERVALKLLHRRLSQRESYRQRLRAEVRLARRVSHPNVCRVHDLGSHEGRLFVTMELLGGQTLRAIMREVAAGQRPALPLPRTVDILVQVCSALAAAHRAGVMHRDVKPDNVMLEDDRVVLTDFGVAGLADDVTQRRVIAGTPSYIAPEVLLGGGGDHRVDVYACAVMAYELLAGQAPFAGRTLEAAIERARAAAPVPPLPPHCAPPQAYGLLTGALMRALADDPRARTPSADALAENLAAAAHGVAEGWSGAAPDLSVGSAATLVGYAQETVGETAPTLMPPDPEPVTVARGQIRVATALCYRAAPVPANATATTSDGEALERIIVDLGGTPLEVAGSRVVAVFGAPLTLGDEAVRAARAAHALLELSGGRAGIDTARILWRPTEDAPPTASGDALRRADALCGEAEAGEIRVSPATARQLVGRFATRDLPVTSVAGIDRAIALGAPDEGSDEAMAVQTELIGREPELDALMGLVVRACTERQPRFARVLAPAGLGKTRLRVELVRRLRERRELDWLLARATPLGASAPLSLLRSADATWFAAAATDAATDLTTALVNARRWLERRALRRPVVLLVEDAQWLDDASRAFLDELRRGLEAVPIAVLQFTRAEAAAGGGGDDLDLELEPLPPAAALDLARNLARTASSDELADLVTKAGGNPFFIAELARDARERGRLGTTTSTATPTHVTPLPETVEAVVQARLDRLPGRAREVLHAAAVVGREFWREAARAALPQPDGIGDAELDRWLAELERRSLVMALPPTTLDDDRYIFHSALVRDVAYQQLEPRERRRAHGAVGHWLERRTAGLSSTDPAALTALAQHRDAAGDLTGAREAWQALGMRCLELHAYREAHGALARAAELAPAPDWQLQEAIGDAASIAESLEVGEEAYRRALALVTGEPLAQARLWRKLGHCASGRARSAEARACYERGLTILAPGGELIPAAAADPTEPAALYGSLGWLLGYQLDDNATGLPFSERAVALLEGTGHRRALAQALSRLGANYMRAGRWRDQLSCNRRNLELGMELGDLAMQLTARINLGVNYGALGEIEQALAHTREALALCGRTGSTTTAALVHSNLGGLLLEVDDLDRAAAHLADALRLAERGGNRRFLPETHGFLARLAVRRGDLDGAEREARHAVDLARTAGLTLDEGIAARILAAVLVRRGELAEPEGLLARSHERLADSDRFEDARTAVAEARWLEARGGPGDRERAAALRDDARAAFAAVGARRDLDLVDDPSDLR